MSSPNKVSQELPAAVELRHFFGFDTDLKEDTSFHNFSLSFPIITTSIKHVGNNQQFFNHSVIANHPDVKVSTAASPAYSILSPTVREPSATSNFDTAIPHQPIGEPDVLTSLRSAFRPQAIKTHRLRKNKIGRIRSEEVKNEKDKCTVYKQEPAPPKNQLSNNFDEVRRSKRNKNTIICYNEDKLMVSSALNKRSCVDSSLSGISSRSQPRIRTGIEYQATNIPEYLGDYSGGDRDNSEHGDETLWLPSILPLNEKHLDEYCAIAQKHQDLNIEDALKALMKNEYDILPTLERLEEYVPIHPTIEWTEEEADIFDDYITSRNMKPFRRVAKQLSNNKTLADVVEYYYRVKKMRCFSFPYKICPHRVSISPSYDTMRVLPRTNCSNCVQSLFQTKANKILRRRYDLCLPCEFYMRLTGRHRSFTVPLGRQESGNSNSASTSASYGLQQYGNGRIAMGTSNTLRERKCHEGCFFKPRISALVNSKEWNTDEILECLKAIKKHGSDWKAVADELGKRSIFEVMQFYNENRHLYSLDTIISLSKTDKNDNVFSPVLQSTNGSACSKYNQNGRILPMSSAAALK